MKVLITGGNGLVGRFIVDELRRGGRYSDEYQIVVFDRQLHTRLPRDVSPVVGNCLEMDHLLRATEGADVVLHLAAAQPGSDSTDDVYGDNVQGTANVFEAATKCGVQVVINWSSVWALGWSTPGNSFTPQYLPIDEKHPLRATDPYGRSKIVGEDIAAAHHGRFGLRVVSLRPVFTATPQAMGRLWGSRRVTDRPYSHFAYIDARDHASAARAAIEVPHESYQTAYLAADDSRVEQPLSELLPRQNPSIGELAEALIGTQSAISNELAARLFDWRPERSWRSLSAVAKAKGAADVQIGRFARLVAPRTARKLRRALRRSR